LKRISAYRFFRDYPATAWAALLFSILVLIRLLLPDNFNGLYGQDSYAYLAQSQSWLDWLQGGPAPPPFFWPEGYPLLGAILGLAITIAAGMQVISMLSTAAILYFSIRLARTLFPDLRGIGPILFLVVGLSPWGLRSGLLVMSDSLGVALLAAAGWWAWCYAKEGKLMPLLGAGLALGLAVSVRYPLALPGLLPVTVVLWGAWKQRDVRLLLFPITIAGLVLAHFSLHTAMEGGLTNHHFLTDWTPANWFRKDFVMQDGQFHYSKINLIYALGGFGHPGLVGLGLIAIPLGIWWKIFVKDRRLLVLAGSMMVYLLFLAGIPFQNPRFLLPMIPFVGLLYLPVLSRLAERLSKNWKYLLGLVVLIVHLGLAGYTSKKLLKMNKSERNMAEVLGQFPEKTVYTFGMDGAIKAYQPNMKVINLWDAPLDSAQVGELVLFNESAFRDQWEGKNPMINWDFLNQNYNLQPAVGFGEGWNLYEIR
jgi:hypothetical protein